MRDSKEVQAAEVAVNEAYQRLVELQSQPGSQSLACGHLRHSGDALPMVHLLAGDEPLHPATRTVLAEWILDQQRKGKIKRPRRGNPNQRKARQFAIGHVGTLHLCRDDLGEMVAARVQEGMSINAAISWVVELLDPLDPTGAPVISEETVKRSYRDFELSKKLEQESDAIAAELLGSDKHSE